MRVRCQAHSVIFFIRQPALYITHFNRRASKEKGLAQSIAKSKNAVFVIWKIIAFAFVEIVKRS